MIYNDSCMNDSYYLSISAQVPITNYCFTHSGLMGTNFFKIVVELSCGNHWRREGVVLSANNYTNNYKVYCLL